MSDLNTHLSNPVRKSAEKLGDLMNASEPFLAFEQARHSFENDAQAQALLAKLNALHQELLALQSQGQLTQEQVTEFRQLQAQVQSNPSIRTYSLAQQASVQYLREINSEISQRLGADFASLARRSCGS
jgi:cell fate (sporulation/competence/biofilm development) regulator YlbF (YheA/YmcA/DUF963 family)